ncbi:methyl-accepting chemotaxis protein [Pseudomonas sp. LRF_L74]|uniref:methyl-accepting chemotaxis protein n=1 Tax=Pseudomonas sp. LRF_L74 TaxID=3369422 RepID=UPI003F5E4C08
MSLRNLNIAPRALLSFALVTLLLILLGVFALTRLSELYKAEQSIETNWLVSIRASDQMQKNLLSIRLESLRLLAVDETGGNQDRDNASIQQYRSDFQRGLTDYERNMVTNDQERAIVMRVRDSFQRYDSNLSQTLELIRQNQLSAALQMANDSLRSLAKQVGVALDELAAFNQQGVKQAGVISSDTYSQGRIGIIATILVAVALTIFLALMLTRSIVRPLSESLTLAETVSAGDLTQRIVANGSDEPARLQAALAIMQGNLNEAIRKIGDSSAQLASAAEEMAAVTEESTRGLQSQNAEIEQAATAVNEMSAAVEEVSRNAIGASDAARGSNEAALNGNRHVAQTIEAIRRLSGRVDDAAGQVQGLAAQSRDISKVLDVIRTIAEQTNLLALNAAIEAARAGEQGRGFAVVADEVRALAHRTSTSTQEIEQMIAAIQSGTDNVVQAMSRSSEEAGNTLKLADDAGHALAHIVEAISEINDRNQQIAAASEQQAHVAREVDRNLVSIRDLSMQSSAGASQTATACNELARLAGDLSSLVARFKV